MGADRVLHLVRSSRSRFTLGGIGKRGRERSVQLPAGVVVMAIVGEIAATTSENHNDEKVTKQSSAALVAVTRLERLIETRVRLIGMLVDPTAAGQRLAVSAAAKTFTPMR